MLSDLIKSLSDSLTEFVKTGKLDFKSLADSIISEIIRIQVNAAIKGVGSVDWMGLIGKGVSAVGGLFSGGGFTKSQLLGGQSFHTGGIVGSDSAPARSLPISTWNNAPRFHSGLKPDEFPSILQKGEGVFTKGQMNALGGGNNEPATTNNTFIINAVDSKSFEDMCRRNPGAIVGPVMNSLKDNKTRTDMRSMLR